MVEVSRLVSPILVVEKKLVQPFGKQIGNTDLNEDFMFTEALLTMVKSRKQPKCSLMDEQDVVYTYNTLFSFLRGDRQEHLLNDFIYMKF